MSRKEEIEAVAKNKYPYIKGLPQSSAHQSIFIEAAEWADATMLDKVCEWLKENIDEDVLVKCGSVIKCMDADEFSEYFRKAMEE